MGGFDSFLKCRLLDRLEATVKNQLTVCTEYILDSAVSQQYPSLDIKFDVDVWKTGNFADSFLGYNVHPELDFKNFLCSFNGTDHVGRKLLVAVLHQFGWFDMQYCSKNFVCSTDVVSGHLDDYHNSRFYRKFFIGDSSEKFFQSINSFGHDRFNHANNIYNIEKKLTSSFLHLVSESMATSYHPFVTEKCLYSVVTRSLFIAYAQPNWHKYVETYFGFKKYNKIFDYKFDSITDPVQRLIELMSMISKFSVLSSDDWRDLYQLEIDTVEYNYDHYFSGRYLEKLKEFQ